MRAHTGIAAVTSCQHIRASISGNRSHLHGIRREHILFGLGLEKARIGSVQSVEGLQLGQTLCSPFFGLAQQRAFLVAARPIYDLTWLDPRARCLVPGAWLLLDGHDLLFGFRVSTISQLQ